MAIDLVIGRGVGLQGVALIVGEIDVDDPVAERHDIAHGDDDAALTKPAMSDDERANGVGGVVVEHAHDLANLFVGDGAPDGRAFGDLDGAGGTR